MGESPSRFRSHPTSFLRAAPRRKGPGCAQQADRSGRADACRGQDLAADMRHCACRRTELSQRGGAWCGPRMSWGTHSSHAVGKTDKAKPYPIAPVNAAQG